MQLDRINDQIDCNTPVFNLPRNNSFTEKGSNQLLSTVAPSHFRDRPMATPATSRTTAQKLYFYKQPTHSVSSARSKKKQPSLPEAKATNTTPSQPHTKNTSVILSSHQKLVNTPQTDQLEHIAQGLPEVKEVAAKNLPEELIDIISFQPQEKDASAIPPSRKKLAVMPLIVSTPHMDRLKQMRGKLHVLTNPMDLMPPHANDIDGQSLACGRPTVSATVSSTMKLVSRHLFFDSLLPLRPMLHVRLIHPFKHNSPL